MAVRNGPQWQWSMVNGQQHHMLATYLSTSSKHAPSSSRVSSKVRHTYGSVKRWSTDRIQVEDALMSVNSASRFWWRMEARPAVSDDRLSASDISTPFELDGGGGFSRFSLETCESR